ncbi:hypothetical protein PVAP13_7KG407850 [Panicum virgatum]|uniref:Uncharacterized protein n=1 Tax=Panicum virgatum TaxID=38727 RepID=A0A8T0QPU0_PANVG|nr:hypothetical protein PVAP13_7KG407850 [Panicum virgatum]
MSALLPPPDPLHRRRPCSSGHLPPASGGAPLLSCHPHTARGASAKEEPAAGLAGQACPRRGLSGLRMQEAHARARRLARAEREQGRRKLRAGRGKARAQQRADPAAAVRAGVRGRGGAARSKAASGSGGVRAGEAVGGGGGAPGARSAGKEQGARVPSSCAPGGRRADVWGHSVGEREGRKRR